MSSIRVRFAPSPTGTLHVGGARTALFNWLYARLQKGVFVLRIEDTDQERSTDASTQQILRSMQWLGLDWDEGPTEDGADSRGDHGPYFQSQRRDKYDEFAARLLQENLAYPCYCTPDELDAMRQKAKAEKRDFGYDGRCRDLSHDERKEREARGRTSVLRVRTPDEGSIRWTDIVHGDMEIAADTVEDWVAVKGDGFPTYNFAAVVDDGLMEISHVLRGDDHISNTPKQIHLFRELGFRIPKFGHMPMILGSDGKRLSKRHGAASVEEFRDENFLSAALVNYLALLGWSPGNDQEVFTVQQLTKKFSLKRLNHSAAVFDPEKLAYINAEHLKLLSDKQRLAMAWPILVDAGLAEADDGQARAKLGQVLKIMGARVSHLNDVPAYCAAYFSDDYELDAEAAAEFDDEAQAHMAKLAEAMAKVEGFDAASAEAALRALADELGLKAGQLIHPARFAVSGQKVGPSVFDVLATVGQERVVQRLRAPRRPA